MYSSWSFVFCLKSECTQIRHFLVHLGKCWSVYDVFEDTVFRQSGAGWNGNRGNVNYVDFRGWITKSSLYCFCLSLRRHFKVFPSRNSSARLMTVVEKSSYILRHDIILYFRWVNLHVMKTPNECVYGKPHELCFVNELQIILLRAVRSFYNYM